MMIIINIGRFATGKEFANYSSYYLLHSFDDDDDEGDDDADDDHDDDGKLNVQHRREEKQNDTITNKKT